MSVSEAERIVRALAESSPWDSEEYCHWCSAYEFKQEPEHTPDCLWLQARAWVAQADAPKGLNARRRALGLPTYDELPMPDVSTAPEPLPPLPDAHAIGRQRLREVMGLHPATERADYEDGRNAWDDETVRRGMTGGER